MRVLKEAASAIAPYLCFIFQQSIDIGSVPADWKHGNIIPVYKKGSRTEAHDYRPVSLTSVLCKVLEHIVSTHHAVLDFQKKILGPSWPQVFIFGRQNKYSSRQKLYLRINGIQ